jgi:hypothetical protein
VNRDAGRPLAPLLALGLFAFVLYQTAHALQDSDVWRFAQPKAVAPVADPLADLDGVIARAQSAPFAGADRDPFAYGSAAPRPSVLPTVARRPTPPPAPETPVLTAIVYDADPRAVLRWKGRDYSVRAGGLFDEFVVVSISREQVVLKRGSDSIVLQRKPQGE